MRRLISESNSISSSSAIHSAMDPLHPEKSEEDPARTKSREPPKSPTLALTVEITIARMATTA
ncbi:hypothetical protein F2Q68_00018252 [Brassica cretica]|uniref:Uncharacterized protein n=1 Tax=Brassica cretica TaxID=69181 RepID=A0A8S9HGA1_BRACR|nr:hypothetical protein F2Q68_00018252 [Brassica cretica]